MKPTNSTHEFGFPWTMQWPHSPFAFPAIRFAPERLWQPINDGWSFGNVVINEQNSSAPALEYAITRQNSYGRQIGRISDALLALLELAPDFLNESALKSLNADKAIASFKAMTSEIQKTKDHARSANMDRLLQELQALKAQYPDAWAELCECSPGQ